MPGRLRRSSCSGPGMTRRRRGKGFQYLDGGEPVTDPETLQRIRDLVIPPAWTDVWICRDERGHLQAVGTDAAGRRQYLYHPEWRTRRDQVKHARVLTVAKELPKARRRVAADLASGRGLSRERVLACTFRLLDLGLFRVGGEEYAEEHGSFGLSTLRREHVVVHSDGRLTFDYTGKHGIRREVVITDADAHSVVRSLARVMEDPHQQLFGWRVGRRWHDVAAADINEYVHGVLGDATAKDFRTWHATVLAAAHLAEDYRDAAAAGRTPMSERARKRSVSDTMKLVSTYLGNTPAVARASYVDPKVVERFGEGLTIERAVRGIEQVEPPFDPKVQERLERAVLKLLS
jgi:DNA topoisomerase-1